MLGSVSTILRVVAVCISAWKPISSVIFIQLEHFAKLISLNWRTLIFGISLEVISKA